MIPVALRIVNDVSYVMWNQCLLKGSGDSELASPDSNFFDDFTVVCEEGECKSVDFYLTGLFKLLGLEYAAEGDKAPPFSELFGSLGILFNLACIHQVSFTLEHTERCKEELLSTLDDLLQADICNTKDLEKLRGRLVWFGSFVFGRQMNVSLRTLNKYAHGAGRRVKQTQELNDTFVGAETTLDGWCACKKFQVHFEHLADLHRRGL